MSKNVLEKWHREIGGARQSVSEWGAEQGKHSDTRCIVELAAQVQALQAWQRRVREEMADDGPATPQGWVAYMDRLHRAIEAEAEPKEEP